MQTRQHRLLSAVLFVLDGLVIAASWVAAYEIRFRLLGLPAPRGVPPLEIYLWFASFISPIGLLVLNSLGVYRPERMSSRPLQLNALVEGAVLTTALAALASYFTRGEMARSVMPIFAALATALLCANRLALRGILWRARRSGRILCRVLIVGTGEAAIALARKMIRRPDYGYALQGFVSAEPWPADDGIEGVPVVGVVSDLPSIVERCGAEQVYVALDRAEHEVEQEALNRLCDSTASVRLVPDLARTFTLHASVEDFDGTPVVLVTRSPDEGWRSAAKRLFDLLATAAALLVLSPALLAIAVWIKLDSAGPVLYSQDRVGLNGRRFAMLKFRTMRTDSEEASGPTWAQKDDPRCTRAGRLLRRLSLDELPQLWNVLAGQMSLVGPRPERPVFVEQFRASVPRYMLRHHVKAGMTGWAQVNGLRGNTPLDRRIEYDLYYIRNWSLAFDLKILLLTIARVFRDPPPW
jgi:Undecaprenyl-phosphate glucose phosphotransferase